MQYCAILKHKEMREKGIFVGHKGMSHTDDAKRKIGAKNSIRQRGEQNSNYGNVWIYNDVLKTSKAVCRNDLQTWLDDGWLIGRKIDFSSKLKICKKCGENKCTRPDICNKHQMINTLTIFGFDISTFGSKKFYDEYDRIVGLISDEYHVKQKSTIDLSMQYGVSTQRIDSIFKSLGIKPRNYKEALRNFCDKKEA